MKMLLKTSFPCLIKTDTQELFLEENDLLEIEDEKSIFVYPENNLDTPFYINPNSPKENERVSVIKHDDRTIILLENTNFSRVFIKESINFLGKSCNILISDRFVSFENNDKKVTCKCTHSCKNYKIFKINNYACVQFEKDLYAYSMNKNKLYHFCADDISVDKNQLYILKKLNDSMGREKHSVYKLENEISLEKEEFMYNSHTKSPEGLLCYKFLESIKANDFDFSFDCLSQNLKTQINKSQLREFFGNIKSFLPVSSTEFITLSHNEKKFVTFSVSNSQIDDVLIDNL